MTAAPAAWDCAWDCDWEVPLAEGVSWGVGLSHAGDGLGLVDPEGLSSGAGLSSP